MIEDEGVVYQETKGCLSLAKAVIDQAMQDATRKHNTHSGDGRSGKDVTEARMFLLGSTKAFKESLEIWCELANVPVENVIKVAKLWESQGWPKYKGVYKS